MPNSELKATVRIVALRGTGAVFTTEIETPASISKKRHHTTTNKINQYKNNAENFFTRSYEGIKFLYEINGRSTPQDFSSCDLKSRCNTISGASQLTICASVNTKSSYSHTNSNGKSVYVIPIVTIKNISLDNLNNMLKSKTLSIENLMESGEPLVHNEIVFDQMSNTTRSSHTNNVNSVNWSKKCSFIHTQAVTQLNPTANRINTRQNGGSPMLSTEVLITIGFLGLIAGFGCLLSVAGYLNERFFGAQNNNNEITAPLIEQEDSESVKALKISDKEVVQRLILLDTQENHSISLQEKKNHLSMV